MNTPTHHVNLSERPHNSPDIGGTLTLKMYRIVLLTHEEPALTEEYAELYKSYDTAERVLERYAFESVSDSLLTILPVYVIVSEKDYHDARNHGCTTVSEIVPYPKRLSQFKTKKQIHTHNTNVVCQCPIRKRESCFAYIETVCPRCPFSQFLNKFGNNNPRGWRGDCG